MSSKDKTYQIFIRGFSRNTGRFELKECFKKFGKLRDINVKTGYAFVDFDKEFEAEDAVEGMNGKEIDGSRLTVELATRDKSKRRGPQQEDECWQCGKKGHWKTECTQYKKPPSRYRERRYSTSRSRDRDRRRDRDRHSDRYRSRRSPSSSYDRRKKSGKVDKKHRRKSSSSSSSSSKSKKRSKSSRSDS